MTGLRTLWRPPPAADPIFDYEAQQAPPADIQPWKTVQFSPPTRSVCPHYTAAQLAAEREAVARMTAVAADQRRRLEAYLAGKSPASPGQSTRPASRLAPSRRR